jgi:nicotinamide-nucleotide amidase
MQAEIITIGDEILIGQTVDTNSAWLGKELNFRGVDLFQITSIQDTEEAIHSALRTAMTRSNLILMTGGLGPTSDDITKNSLTKFFDTSLVLDEEALSNIQERFKYRGIPMLQINKEQALVPQNCTPIHNLRGTAPGMMFQENGKWIISMPGVPYEMKDMMQRVVFPMIEKRVTDLHIVHRTITVVNIPESVLSDNLKEIEAVLPAHIKLAYLPNLNLVRLRLTAKSKQNSIEQLHEQINRYFVEIKRIIGPSYFDGDKDLSQVVGQMLQERDQRLGTVESCTGGFIAHSISRVPGSSHYYKGGMVTYANQLKSELLDLDHELFFTVGSVSEEVARDMARNGKKTLGVDYCIAVTGIAGPGGATDTKPVGLVYIGLALPNGIVKVSEHRFKGTRMQIIERTAFTALELVRQHLNLH